LLIGIAPIMGSDLPRRPLANRLSARLFGGVSGGVFRGMATLALGSGIGRVIGITAIPVLTRLYTPEDFGALAVFTALVAILAPLVTLRYVLALPLPRHDGVAMNLLVLSFALMLLCCALIALALGLWGGALLTLVSMQVLAPWWWLIALGVLGTATYEMLTMWATRKRAYKVIAQTNVTQSAAGAVVKIGLGLAAWAPLGLLVGQVVAQTGGIGRLITGFGADLRAQWHHLRASRIRKAAWRHRGFPIWRVPSQFLMVFAQKFILIFFALTFGSATTGQLSVSLLSLTIASNLIAASVSKSFYGEIARITSNTDILRLMKEIVLVLAVISAPLSLVLFYSGSWLTVLVLGSNWLLAGRFVEIICLYLPFSLIAVSLSSVLNKIEKQSAYFLLNFVRALGVSAVLIFSYYLEFSPERTLMSYAFAMILLQSGTIGYFFLAVKNRSRND
jgi:O-antigen/teichoic acid export membrane protein